MTKEKKETVKKSKSQAKSKTKDSGKKSKTVKKTPKKSEMKSAKDSPSKKTVKSKKTPAKRAKSTAANKRERSDGISKSVDVAQSALREIEPPKHVRFLDRDWPFWDSVINEFPKVEWTDHTLEIAALLTRALSDFEMEQHRMRNEGAILDKKQVVPKPTPEDPEAVEVVVTGTYMNPRKLVIDMHSRNVLAYRRSLSLHARAKAGEPRDRARSLDAAKKREDEITGMDADKMNLIAFPKKDD